VRRVRIPSPAGLDILRPREWWPWLLVSDFNRMAKIDRLPTTHRMRCVRQDRSLETRHNFDRMG